MPALSFDQPINSKFGFPLHSSSKTKLDGGVRKTKVSKTLTGLLKGEKQSTADSTAPKSTQSNKDSTIVCGGRSRANSLARGAGTPGRRGEKRLRPSGSSNHLHRSPKVAKTEEVDDEDHYAAPGSPTPSIATTHGGLDEIDEDVDMLTELPSFGNQIMSSEISNLRNYRQGLGNVSRAVSTTDRKDETAIKLERRAVIQRSLSLPAGLFGVVSAELARSSSTTSNGVDELEVKNKAVCLIDFALAGARSIYALH